MIALAVIRGVGQRKMAGGPGTWQTGSKRTDKLTSKRSTRNTRLLKGQIRMQGARSNAGSKIECREQDSKAGEARADALKVLLADEQEGHDVLKPVLVLPRGSRRLVGGIELVALSF